MAMDQLPKTLFKEGTETQVEKFNNTCRTSILKKVEKYVEAEYKEVLGDPLFSQVMDICVHKLQYSGRVIHSFVCKQLLTAKRHELWFHFARRALRFSMQEFHAAVLIPRIVKAVQSSDKKKDFNVKQYAVSYVPMRALNTSGNDCGAYSLKFIECHLLGLDFSLVNDDNIQEAQHKIAFDLWEAANDEALQYRMSTFKPPKRAPEKTVELF
ncbi:hypothetical protein DY000_02059729 [Brassica cretica]|uniref:Ubiquitin-like protease family profile domain-containing protein n=1 Tax=Brassica cretica TaxID=69181 RepID=A0ABQ7B0Q0_BRACR|nr:hypothetical protein DY000_02059729 [Brassica cretica]